MRRTITVAMAAAAVAVAGCSSAGSPTTSSSAAAPVTTRLSWHHCPKAAAGEPNAGRLLCAKLKVPLDYSHPAGRHITLALSEIPATAPAGQQRGALLVNPGGPGASGLSFAATVAATLAPSVAAQYNIVGFDTRGVGSSVPALRCDPSFFSRPRPYYVPRNKAAEQVLIGRARQYAADCQKHYGWLLPHMTTQDLAKDMDSIRVALGQQKISYYGVSYGTYLGQVYATLFPHRLRRMVLDSIVDPAGVWYADNIAQDYAFQGRFNAFLDWIAANDKVYRLGATRTQVLAAYDAALAKLASYPIPGTSGPLIGPDELTDTLLQGGYADYFWPYLAAALANYVHRGSAQDLISLYQQIGQQKENEFAVYLAVQCTDASWPRNWSTWNADTRRVNAKAPFETWSNTWFNASCAFWPVKGAAKPMTIGASGLPPILLLQGTLDAATPYRGALVVRKRLPTSRLVVTVGSGDHGQSVDYPPNPCVDRYLNQYLANGSLPTKPGIVNATCPATPAPKA